MTRDQLASPATGTRSLRSSLRPGSSGNSSARTGWRSAAWGEVEIRKEDKSEDLPWTSGLCGGPGGHSLASAARHPAGRDEVEEEPRGGLLLLHLLLRAEATLVIPGADYFVIPRPVVLHLPGTLVVVIVILSVILLLLQLLHPLPVGRGCILGDVPAKVTGVTFSSPPRAPVIGITYFRQENVIGTKTKSVQKLR